MAPIVVSVLVDAPLSRVWDAVSDLESHPTWMKDAEYLAFESLQHRGIGTRIQVATRVGPFRTDDPIEVVEWEERRSIGVRHAGVVSGRGRFELAAMAGGTRFTWTEELRFPWWLGGRLTLWLARPILERIWRGNLRRFQLLIETGLSDR